MLKNKKRDFSKAISKTHQWGNLRKIYNSGKVKIALFHRFQNEIIAFELTHPLDYMPKGSDRRWNKAVKKHNNGGGERAFRGMRKVMSKREISENIGKSSRQYSRMRKEWWNHDCQDLS